jgi:predicted ATPase
LRAESFYNVASEIDNIQEEVWWMLWAYWWKSLHSQSHGESFFSLFLNRFGWNWVYILDEPEAALSPQRQLAFLLRLDELVKQNSQFIIVTHSPIILSYPNAKIIEIWKNGFEEVLYKDTSHYNTYKMFLDNPEYMLKKMDIK